VMAQDILADDRFRHAVVQGDDGYFRVNYAALGLSVVDADQMQAASELALAA
jgi:hypothetical protein